MYVHSVSNQIDFHTISSSSPSLFPQTFTRQITPPFNLPIFHYPPRAIRVPGRCIERCCETRRPTVFPVLGATPSRRFHGIYEATDYQDGNIGKETLKEHILRLLRGNSWQGSHLHSLPCRLRKLAVQGNNHRGEPRTRQQI